MSKVKVIRYKAPGICPWCGYPLTLMQSEVNIGELNQEGYIDKMDVLYTDISIHCLQCNREYEFKNKGFKYAIKDPFEKEQYANEFYKQKGD